MGIRVVGEFPRLDAKRYDVAGAIQESAFLLVLVDAWVATLVRCSTA